MGREIEFRSCHYRIKDQKFNHFSYWGAIDHKGNSSKDCFSSPSSASSCYRKHEEQYIRLKDKNGKKIFEGDILYYTIFDHNDNDTQFKGVVKWFGAGFIVTQIPDKLCNGDYGLELFWVHNQDCEIEVIGNIHENKNLID
jgi:uncharacterized phage protein (TIGR01671 family)